MRNSGNMSINKHVYVAVFFLKDSKGSDTSTGRRGLASNRYLDSSNENIILLYIMFPRDDVQNNVIWKYFEVTLPQLC